MKLMLYRMLHYQKPKQNYRSVQIDNIIFFSPFMSQMVRQITLRSVSEMELDLSKARKKRDHLFMRNFRLKTQCLLPNTFFNHYSEAQKKMKKHA